MMTTAALATARHGEPGDVKSADGPRTRPAARRKSNSLGADPRGDTGVPALATLDSPIRQSLQRPARHSKRRKARSFLHQCIRQYTRHTWLLPLTIVIVILSSYMVNPTSTNPLYACIFLSYPIAGHDSSPGALTQYGKGRADFAFVAFYTVVLSFTREFLMQRVIKPMAIYYGIRKRAKQDRFMEQVYTAMYFGILGPLGLYIMYRSPVWYFDTTAMFEAFPHRTHEGLFKAYYLIQASYWAQQAVVLLLMLERPRKDFKELVLHHIVTLSLIWTSYRFHFTYMGIAVYITHDISDFFLATSKTLNYIDSPITAPFFTLFVGIWIYMRHYINLHILWATLTEFRSVGPFTLDWDAQQYKCRISQIICFALLTVLQAVNIFWLYLILRIMKRKLMTQTLADERSEDETEDDVVQQQNEKKHVKSDEASKVKDQSVVADKRVHGRPQVLLNGSPVEAASH